MYLVKNKPVKVVGWGKEWPCLEKWKNKEYFLKNLPTEPCELTTLTGPNADSFSAFNAWPTSRPVTFEQAIKNIMANGENMKKREEKGDGKSPFIRSK